MDAGEPSSDPALLFTPEKSLLPSQHSEISPQPTRATETVLPQRAFFILAPHLSDEQKSLYKPAAEASSIKDNPEILLDEVIGKYREHNVSYYYARYRGGLAHKVRGIHAKLGSFNASLHSVFFDDFSPEVQTPCR